MAPCRSSFARVNSMCLQVPSLLVTKSGQVQKFSPGRPPHVRLRSRVHLAEPDESHDEDDLDDDEHANLGGDRRVDVSFRRADRGERFF